MCSVPANCDPEFAPLVDQCNKIFDELWKLPLAEFKAAWASTPPSLREEVPSLLEIDVRLQSVPVSGGGKVEIQIYSPKDGVAARLPLLFVTHGGGWVVGTHSIEESMTRMVCVRNKCRVVSVDYRMAPEYKFPYAVNDSWEVLQWCRDQADALNIDPNRIILGGSSAGGNLAAALAIRARDEGMSGVVGQILNIPVTCHPKLFPKNKYTYTSYQENANAPIVDAARMNWFWDQYLPEPDDNPHHSPLLAKSLSGLAPALIQVAGMDPLRDEGLAYAEALKQAGVDVQLKFYQGLPHGFGMWPQLSRVEEYNQSVADWVRDLLKE